MIVGASSVMQSYMRSTSNVAPTQTLTPADAQPNAPAATDQGTRRPGIDMSQLKPLKGTLMSIADSPGLRDLMATNWLRAHDTSPAQSSVSDDAPENTYAYVKVNGKVAATLYNGGSSTMTNEAAAKIGSLQDPPGLSGPNLAQWRADNYATLLGGTVQKASTAITQSQWTPHESSSTTYSRDQLDAAWQAIAAEGQRAAAQFQSSYLASSGLSGASTDLTA